MCKPNGKTGIPAACPRRGDCRGCPMLLSAVKEERPSPVGLPGDVPQIWQSYGVSEKIRTALVNRAKIIRI